MLRFSIRGVAVGKPAIHRAMVDTGSKSPLEAVIWPEHIAGQRRALHPVLRNAVDLDVYFSGNLGPRKDSPMVASTASKFFLHHSFTALPSRLLIACLISVMACRSGRRLKWKERCLHDRC